MGMGKLGLPCALAIESKGHDVVGYDVDPNVEKYIKTREIPYRESGAPELLLHSNIRHVSVQKMVSHSDIIFVPIQTPHDEKYEGITRLPEERVDFDYTWLQLGMATLSQEIEKQSDPKVVIIISTVLPGTIREKILPIVGDKTKLCYNPFFIAMGTTIDDFLNPEFVLFGRESKWAEEKAIEFYATIHDKPVVSMSIESAELCKVAYNTIITSKINIANTLMEICHKIDGANVDDVTNALKLATDRVVSPKYMDGGMGDGGGCHPRDNIALSWLARELDLSHDIYEDLMLSREHQTQWLAELCIEERDKIGENTPIIILGYSFKPETALIVGSPAMLLKNILLEMVEISPSMYDPFVDGEPVPIHLFNNKAVYFIGTKHPEFANYGFPEGSTIIDPFRYIPNHGGCKVIRIGE